MGKVTVVIESESRTTEEVRESVQGWIDNAYDLDPTEYKMQIVVSPEVGKMPRKFKRGFQGVWSDFGLSPNVCMKKVSEGKLRIAGKDQLFGRNLYEVVEEFEA